MNTLEFMHSYSARKRGRRMNSVMNGVAELFKNLCPKPQCVNCNHLQIQFSNGSCLLMCNIDNKECPHWTEKEQNEREEDE